jgi:hypothetical protein
MGPIGCPEASGKDYHSTLRNIPEERTPHQMTVFPTIILNRITTHATAVVFVFVLMMKGPAADATDAPQPKAFCNRMMMKMSSFLPSFTISGAPVE